jgi:hypothetical protein
MQPKPGIRTTEFWFSALTVIGMITAASVNVLPSKYAALLIVISGAAYKLSRGLAKVGSPPALEGTPGLSPTEPPQDGTTEPPA